MADINYCGSQDVDPHLVLRDREPLDFRPSLKVWNHSPTGFSWGYGGSGPAQLALALLLDATGNKRVALAMHQEFKWQFVARWSSSWTMTSSEIQKWVAEQPVAQAEMRLV